MAFTVTKNIEQQTVVAGVVVNTTTENVEIEYQIEGVYVNGFQGTAEYSRTISGVKSQDFTILNFEYSGSGDPIKQAEDYLKENLC